MAGNNRNDQSACCKSELPTPLTWVFVRQFSVIASTKISMTNVKQKISGESGVAAREETENMTVPGSIIAASIPGQYPNSRQPIRQVIRQVKTPNTADQNLAANSVIPKT